MLEATVKWALVILMVFGTGVNVANASKPRKPSTPGIVFTSALINLLFVAAIIAWWD